MSLAGSPLRIPQLARATTSVLDSSPSFRINAKNKSYTYQYSNIYFIRLQKLRPYVEQRAKSLWAEIDGQCPSLVPRVLDVVTSKVCYIIGTVYMDMPLKPNVMEDIARDHSIPPPPPNPKFYSAEDNVMLEDESGRVRLVGDRVKDSRLVTGIVLGALGFETSNGDFEVIDLCFPGMAPQDEPDDVELKMEIDGESSPQEEWIAVISGLHVGSTSPSDAQIQTLVEYLAGEGGGVTEQVAAAQISRVIIAGNSLASLLLAGEPEEPSRKAKKYGYETATFSPHPVINLSDYLLDIASTLPLHILAGESDPSGIIMPQQPLPKAMFGAAGKLSTFYSETNPTYLRLGCLGSKASGLPTIQRTLLVNSGQPLDDIFKYLPSPPNTRLSILESTLKWRHLAPTAPDTLWCHPYFDDDPFVITKTPDIYIVGNQKRFATKIVFDENEHGEGPKIQCRIVMVPEFARTGVLVLVNLRSLEVRTVTFAVQGMTGADEQTIPSPAPRTSSSSSPPGSPSTLPQSSQNSELM